MNSDWMMIAYQLGPTSMQIVPAPGARQWMDDTPDRYGNRCLPLRIANQSGWFLLNESSFEAQWDGESGLQGVTIRHLGGSEDGLPKSHFGDGILTWHIPFLFRTPPEFNLLVRGPVNLFKDAIQPLEGIVETDWASMSFTMNWKFTRPFVRARFDVGEPICMIVPQRKHDLDRFEPQVQEIESNPDLHAAYLAWSRSRDAFMRGLREPNADVKAERAPWQKHYFRGVSVTNVAAQEHQTKLHLQPFANAVSSPPSPAPQTEDRQIAVGIWSAGKTRQRSPRDQALIVDHFLERAPEMRRYIDDCFERWHADFGSASGVWEFKSAADHSTCRRTDPSNLMSSDLVDDFAGCLAAWSGKFLGRVEVSRPSMCLYASGCGQAFWKGDENGLWRYFYSLTHWQERRFSGGEVLVLTGESISDSGGVASGRDCHTTIAPEFNRLLVIDETVLHAVDHVKNSIQSFDGLLVLQGSIQVRESVLSPTRV